MNINKGTAKQRELQSSLWIYQPQSQQHQAIHNERNDSDVAANSSESDLFALDYDDGNYDSNTSSGSALKKHFESHIQHEIKQIALNKLCVVKLDSISIPSTTESVQHVLNLKQEFTFPSITKPLKDSAVQTPNLLAFRQKTPHPNSLKHQQQAPASRPASFPNEALSNHKLNDANLINLKQNPKQPPEHIGDGIQNNLKQIKKIECDLVKNDLEITGVLPVPQTPVQCVLIKPKKHRQPTPSYPCKKSWRPQTRQSRKKELISASTNSSDDGNKKNTPNDLMKRGKIQNNETSHMRGGDMTTSEASTEAGLDMFGNHYSKLSAVVDKLQDHEWEVCLDGLRSFQSLAAAIDWESEIGLRFIPIISRKLIDFFKSPRSNLCRTACQTAGEFFVFAKSTKRPEFDEMVDILLCKCADPNRFIQKDANVALDKMAMCINVHHSVRAVTVKGADHKNPIVRATAARLLTHICKHAGVEQIVGVDANPRTRKRVLFNLGKFLMDKNVETRRHAEKLCRMLKRHKFFMEYFFKETENNSKATLRRILHTMK